MTKQNQDSVAKGDTSEEVLDDKTISQDGVSKETPNKPEGDGELDARTKKLIEEATKQVKDEVSQKYEQDISNLRSKLDSNLSAKEKDWQQREQEYKQRLFELETKDLPAEEVFARKEQLYQEELNRLQDVTTDLQHKLTEKNSAQEWVNYFTQNGVPTDQLDLTAGLNELIQSGYNFFMDAYKQTTQAQAENREEEEQAREDEDEEDDGIVLTSSGRAAGGNLTWADYLQKGYTQEDIYQLVEDGTLDPSAIPEE